MHKEYIEELHELRETLRFLLNKKLLSELVTLAELIDRSYVDSYNRIKENSQYGRDCGYAVKAAKLFYNFQYDAIVAHVNKVKDLISWLDKEAKTKE